MSDNLLLLGGFFIFVLGVSSVIAYFLFARKAEVERSELIGELLVAEEPGRTFRGMLIRVFHSLGATMPSSESSRKAIRQRLDYAGYRGSDAMTAYYGMKCTVAVLMGVIVCLISIWNQQSGSVTIGGPLAAAICGLGFGFLLPERFLDAMGAARNDRIRRALPAALDLIVMSLEAGQSLDQALVLASKGLGKFSPELSSEFMQVHLETRASKSRAEAVQHLSERNGETELRKLCNLLTDSDRFGCSLAPTLRQHSKFLRVRFRQRAQEQARKLTVKMVFPVFFLIFPSILVITLGPAVLTLMKTFREFGS